MAFSEMVRNHKITSGIAGALILLIVGIVSFAVSNKIAPQAWHIADDRLFLFNGTDPKADWVTALGSGVIATGDANWGSR